MSTWAKLRLLALGKKSAPLSVFAHQFSSAAVNPSAVLPRNLGNSRSAPVVSCLHDGTGCVKMAQPSRTIRTRKSRSRVGTHFGSQSRVGAIGAPLEKGQMKTGVGDGPNMIRESGLERKMFEIGVDYVDYGDVSVKNIQKDRDAFQAHHPRTFAVNNLNLADTVERILLEDHRVPLILGGDHSLAAGSILGHARYHPDLCVVWVDAHADINSPLVSKSGNLHGMPLAFLIKEIQPDVPWIDELADFVPCISTNNLLYIGLRDIDPYERWLLDKYKIAYYDMNQIDRRGIYPVIVEGLNKINPRLVKPIHLSFDIDSLDPKFAHSTGTPVSGGLTLRDGLLVCEEIYNTGCLSGMDLVEVNPQLGSMKEARVTATAAVDIILSAFGSHRAGFCPKFMETPSSLGLMSREEGFRNLQLYNEPRPKPTAAH